MLNLASLQSQAALRSGEQLRGSVPSSAKVDVEREGSDQERDILAQLPLDQLLKEVRVAPPPEAAQEMAELNLLDASRRSLSPRHVTNSSVLVHVYNLNEAFVKANKVLSMAIGGAFHAGVEIFGWEWSYGTHGVKKTLPRFQTRHVYKCSVFLGESEVDHAEFARLLTESFQDFHGDDYELVGHNCCSFARALVKKLGVRSMPSWVDRLARGLNLGAKAGRMATQPMKQAAKLGGRAAALGGRVLRMGGAANSDSESEEEDDCGDHCAGGVPVPGQVGGSASPVQQPLPRPSQPQPQQPFPMQAQQQPQLATGMQRPMAYHGAWPGVATQVLPPGAATLPVQRPEHPYAGYAMAAPVYAQQPVQMTQVNLIAPVRPAGGHPVQR